MRQARSLFITTVSAFLIGYMIGADHIPKGIEFMIFCSVSFIAGALLTRSALRMMESMRKSKKRLQMLGYELTRVEKTDEEAPSPLALVTSPKCDLCNDEEVRIGSHKIQCPKCKSGDNQKISRKRKGLA